jgi:DNA polymerase-3 subunit beta
MKVTFDRSELLTALKHLSSLIPNRSPKPVLLCTRIVATDDGVELRATDLSMSLTLKLAMVDVESAGDTLIPCQKLAEIVRAVDDETVSIGATDESAEINSGGARFTLWTMDPADFPSMQGVDAKPQYQIDAGDYKWALRQVEFATARKNSRYAMSGVLLQYDGGKLNWCATDGHCLALASMPLLFGDGELGGSVVPIEALRLVGKIAENGEDADSVDVTIGDNDISFATNRFTLWSQLIEAQFPPYGDVIPSESSIRAKFDTASLRSALVRAALLTNEESRGVRLDANADGGKLSSRAPEMGEAEVSLLVESYEGDAIAIGFDPKLLAPALKCVDAETVTLEFNAANKPIKFETGGSYTFVFMPIRLS